MTTLWKARLVAVLTRVLLLTLLITPMNACRDHELLAPPPPHRSVPKLNRNLANYVAVASPVDMNTSGTVVGTEYYATQVHAALSLGGTAYDLGTIQSPEASTTYPAGINNNGQVVGIEYDGSAPPYGFLWTPDLPNGTIGTMQRADGPNGPAQPLDINDEGQILASNFDGTGIILWAAGSAVELPSPSAGGTVRPRAINKYGQIAGTVDDANGTHAFLWTPAQPNGTAGSYVLLDAPGAGGTTAAGLNDFGQVVVNAVGGNTQLWTPSAPNGASGGFVALMSAYGPLTAVDINNRGDVLAGGGGPDAPDCGTTSHLYLWHPAGPNGTTGALADVTPELGFNGGWEYVVYCWASGTFVSEEENATIQAFGQVIDSYYSAYDQVWTLGGLDASPLAATISWSGSPDEGSGLSFDGGSNNPYSSGLSYHWDFGDGTTATDRFAYHAYGDNGQYTVRLTVADGTGGSNTVSTTITINNVSPTATFSVAPQYPGEGSTYLLSVNSVSDAPGDLSTLQLTLDCGDGRGYQSVAVTGSLACSAPNETVRTAGAQLRDKDGGVATYTSPVTVIDLPPAVSIVSAPTTISDQSNYVISFKFLDPGVLDTWSYTIYWGDGTTSSPVSVSTQGGTLSATHRYTVNKRGGTKSAQYSVTVGVTDNGGATGYANSTVLVTTNGYRP